MARRADYYFRETATGLRRNGLVAFAAVATVFISLFLFGGAQLIGKQIGLVVDQQTQRVEVAVFLRDGLSTEQNDRLLRRLQDMPEVAAVDYESKQEACDRFRELFKNQPDLVNNVRCSALPASFRVKLVDPEKFEVVKAQMEGQPGVEVIRDHRDLLKRLFAVANVLKTGAYLASAVMLISAIALIANTVRMAVFARRKEIGVMRLVGATNWFIRVPFLIEALVEGLLGAILALIALTFLKNSFFNGFQSNDTLNWLPIVSNGDLLSLVPIIVVAGVAVSVFASWLAMRRFLEV
jgi:cell division transport system permease protein